VDGEVAIVDSEKGHGREVSLHNCSLLFIINDLIFSLFAEIDLDADAQAERLPD